MPESLPELESRRTELVRQFARLGDLHSGSIFSTSGRCGKPNCHCQPRSTGAWSKSAIDLQGSRNQANNKRSWRSLVKRSAQGQPAPRARHRTGGQSGR